MVSIRPSVSKLDFPPKRLQVGETSNIIYERIINLQKFLTELNRLLTINSLHPSTLRLQLALQYFLEISEHWYSIIGLEKLSNNIIRNNLQCYIHSILLIKSMNKVIDIFIDNFYEDSIQDSNRVWTIKSSHEILFSVRDYINNLQNVIYDGIYLDCYELIKQFHIQNNTKLNSINVWSQLKQNTMKFNDKNEIEKEEMKNNENEILLRLTEDELRLITRIAIRKHIELLLYIPTMTRMNNILQITLEKTENILQKKILILKSHKQQFFGIHLNHISMSNWDDIITKFNHIPLKSIPYDRIEMLLNISKDIPILFQKEHPDMLTPLGADEFLPIFIYILIQSNLTNILLMNLELQNFIDNELKFGEIGYYLATFEASIQHIYDFNETAVSNTNNNNNNDNNFNENNDNFFMRLKHTDSFDSFDSNQK